MSVREEYIKNAVDFLTDPRIVTSSDDKKRKFLTSKGLTNEEIEEAYKRAGVKPSSPDPPTQPQAPPTYPQAPSYPSPSVPVRPPLAYPKRAPQEIEIPWKTMAFVVLWMSTLSSVMFHFIRKYIVPLFWKPKKENTEKNYVEQMALIHQQVTTLSKQQLQLSSDIKDSLVLVKEYLVKMETANTTNKLFLQYKESEEETKLASLKKEISEIKFLVPTLIQKKEAETKELKEKLSDLEKKSPSPSPLDGKQQ
uniref:Peroxisomal membrane protein PEX14 n=1 Tax=Arcella intermedia TaxID=1963864 RepID=A0A6B2LF10_9EUKA|eukprot:TRINITY_DN10992_c0_g1_i1.p1 TRINITY_DN10992_c0_g1~~TRINITY_DN10992_c0_g1_i1.p1  ORF type:complete len:259 (+),score=61.53 TRINITY_DN10992_c0_g1_i1:23-778(+)